MNKKVTNYGKKDGEIKRQTEKKIILKKKMCLFLFLYLATYCFQIQLFATQVVAFYNCENFYDTTNQIIVNDEEFLPNSAKGYSASRYAQKTGQLSKVLFGLGQLGTKDGLALLGVAEIENQYVLEKVIQSNLDLLDAGYQWAEAHLDLRYVIPAPGVSQAQVVMNGNTAVALGTVASGMDVCAMYPITPATSASHYLSVIFEDVGGVVHQAAIMPEGTGGEFSHRCLEPRNVGAGNRVAR